ncbi:MAG: flavodoxin domain-containing protein [Bacillota bacterium]
MSKTLIAYATKHGSAEECAKALAAKIDSGTDLCNLKEKKQIDLDAYDTIIVGGSIYAGRIQKEVRDFCIKNENELKKKKLGLFICGMSEGELAEKQVQSSFPQGLLSKALAKDCFGGRFDFSKLNFMEKAIVKKVAKVDSDQSNISENRIAQFAQILKEA